MTGRVLIYQQQRKATQSAKARARWCLRLPHDDAPLDALTGWTGGGEAGSRLFFANREQAIAYATRMGLPYHLEGAPRKIVKGKNYAAQFIKGSHHRDEAP